MTNAMRRVADDELISAWHSTETTVEIAKRFGVDTRNIRRGWQRLQQLEQIPRVPRDDEKDNRWQQSQGANTDYGGPQCEDCAGIDPLLDALKSGRR